MRKGKSEVVPPNSDNLALAVHRNVHGAIERLVRQHQDGLFSYALRLVQDRFEAQEVTQDAFVRAIQALTSRYDEERVSNLNLKSWLFRITHNLAHNRRRKRRLAAEVPLRECGNRLGQACLPLQGSDQALNTLVHQSSTDRALARLGARARDLILLRFMEEMSYGEIAALTHTSESSVRGMVFRALRELRKILAEMEDRNAM